MTPREYEQTCLRGCPFRDDCHDKSNVCPLPKDASGRPIPHAPLIQDKCGVPLVELEGVTCR